MEAEIRNRKRDAGLVVLVLLGSMCGVAVAPWVVGGTYSILADSISESAGQAVEGAWVARSGLALFGLGVMWLADLAKERWGGAGTVLHRVFGLMMLASAVFSAKAWAGSGLPYVAFEDTLHSWAATIMGLGFAFGAMAVGRRRFQLGGKVQALDYIGFAASMLLPGVMFFVMPGVFGILQRTLFVIAYAWYGAEAVRLRTPTSVAPAAHAPELYERRTS